MQRASLRGCNARSGPKSGQKGGEMASFDHSKLKGLAREKGETVESLSRLLGVSMKTLSAKWNGKSSFSDIEIYALAKYFGISDLEPYFFTPRV